MKTINYLVYLAIVCTLALIYRWSTRRYCKYKKNSVRNTSIYS